MAQLVKENAINPTQMITVTLLGTSGNGKTEFAKAMAQALFDDEKAMKKITFTGAENETQKLPTINYGLCRIKSTNRF